MKRSTMSLIVIITTIISVMIMLYNSGSITLSFNQINEIKSSASSGIRGVSNKLVSKGNSVLKYFDESFSQLQSAENVENVIGTEVISNDEYKEEVSRANENSVPANASINYNSIVVFKMPREEIKEKLSSEERAMLASLAGKISPVDYLKIESYIENEESEMAVINSIALLKTRLSKKDYEKLREIASKYIEIERIEKLIST